MTRALPDFYPSASADTSMLLAMLCKLLLALTKNYRSTAFGGKLCQPMVKSHNPPDCEKRVWPPFGAFYSSNDFSEATIMGGYGLLWPPLVANGSAPLLVAHKHAPCKFNTTVGAGCGGATPVVENFGFQAQQR